MCPESALKGCFLLTIKRQHGVTRCQHGVIAYDYGGTEAMSAEQTRKSLAIRITAAALGASAGLVSPDAAVAGAALTPMLEDALGHIFDRIDSQRRENAAETLMDAADEFDAETPEQFMKFIEGAVSNPQHQELLARGLTIAQDTAMRDKRRALGRALASAVAETGTTVDEELAFIRTLADLDPADIRVLRLTNTVPEHLLAGGYEAKQWYPWSIAQVDPGLAGSAWTSFRVLEQHGLVWSSGNQLTPHGHQPEYSITGLGEYFLARLADPEVPSDEHPVLS